MLYNINRDTKKDPKGIDWLSVFPEWKDRPTEQTEDEMFEALSAFAKSTEGIEPST